jgi:WD40 repeat protein
LKIVEWDYVTMNYPLLFDLDVTARLPLTTSANGQWLVMSSGVCDGRLMVYDMVNQRKARVIRMHLEDVPLAVLSQDGSIIASLSVDKTVCLTDVTTGMMLTKLAVTTVHKPTHLALSPDCQTVVSIWGPEVFLWKPYEKDYIKLYNVNNERIGETRPLCVSPDCEYIACETDEGIEVLAARTCMTLGKIGIVERDWPVTTAAFSPQGHMLVLGRSSGVLEVYFVGHAPQ